MGTVPEKLGKVGDIVGDQRAFVAHERFGHFRNYFRDIDFEHHAATRVPFACPAAAARKARSTRHGAAMICTPSGRGLAWAAGAAITGRPAASGRSFQPTPPRSETPDRVWRGKG
jgi:hypothetical protein